MITKITGENYMSITQSEDREIQYIYSLRFDLKKRMKKAIKRTGLSRAEINVKVAKAAGKFTDGKSHLDYMTSMKYYLANGDIGQTQYERIAKLIDRL